MRARGAVATGPSGKCGTTRRDGGIDDRLLDDFVFPVFPAVGGGAGSALERDAILTEAFEIVDLVNERLPMAIEQKLAETGDVADYVRSLAGSPAPLPIDVARRASYRLDPRRRIGRGVLPTISSTGCGICSLPSPASTASTIWSSPPCCADDKGRLDRPGRQRLSQHRQLAGRPLRLGWKRRGRGKSGLHGNTVPGNARRGRPQGKCHRKQTARPASASRVRVKGWGKSPPRDRRRDRHGKPHREQNRIGTTRGSPQACFRASRPGRLREASGNGRPR